MYDGVAKSLVSGAVSGVNGTIFAYGQTSSGKTFTMQGGGQETSGCDEKNYPGVVHMAASDIFKLIGESPNRDYLLRVSYLEIYNEEIRDLLNPDASKLAVREVSMYGCEWIYPPLKVSTDWCTCRPSMDIHHMHFNLFTACACQ